MVTLNQFDLGITPGTERDDQYHVLENGTTYSVLIANRSSYFCDATVEIDGGVVANRRLNPYETTRIERPDAINKTFVFYSASSDEGKFVGMDAQNDNLGLIKVTIRSGELEPPRSQPIYQSRGLEKGLQAGGTALGGTSSQSLIAAAQLVYHKQPPMVLMLRLVANKPPEITPIQSAFLTNTPPPIR